RTGPQGPLPAHDPRGSARARPRHRGGERRARPRPRGEARARASTGGAVVIVRTLEDALRSERTVEAKTWRSVRMVLADDRVGFSFHITTIHAGTETPIWYKHHFESV